MTDFTEALMMALSVLVLSVCFGALFTSLVKVLHTVLLPKERSNDKD
ncbi:hypothetical protein bas59_0139 [Escherichia phage EduardKellenberger]|uniref:Phage protein n=1 Tax=Escherichia phage EduardKellenberger TaxID=2852031 RepID=A0ABX8SN19_9CAUD|nr:hypothetical protein bas59_0139 [Escherichia phage EduardKellenberger]